MLDLPRQPVLDKERLIGRCARLHLTFDAARFQAEIERMPAGYWGGGGRTGVQQAAEAIFLRGFPPAVGDKPIDDRPALAFLPYARELAYDTLGAPPLRCLLARLPAGGYIAPHVDVPPYFSKTLRIHFPIVTNPQCLMYSQGLVYAMGAGEIWALNNSATHAVWNRHATHARTHMICDFLPAPALLERLAGAERELGRRDEAMEERLSALPAPERLY